MDTRKNKSVDMLRPANWCTDIVIKTGSPMVKLPTWKGCGSVENESGISEISYLIRFVSEIETKPPPGITPSLFALPYPERSGSAVWQVTSAPFLFDDKNNRQANSIYTLDEQKFVQKRNSHCYYSSFLCVLFLLFYHSRLTVAFNHNTNKVRGEEWI